MISRLLLLVRSSIVYAFLLLLRKDEQRRYHLKTSIATLGGVYVKMMQFITLRTEIFNKEDKLEFLGFYDQVPIEHIDVASYLQTELSHDALRTFSSIEEAPFASGTFGQVYRATLTSGIHVVIKIKRSQQFVALVFDFLMIKLITTIAAFVTDEKKVDIKRLIREFEEITWKELDYETEVENAQLLYKHYKDHPVIVIPYTYAELSTSNIIVQEYIGGISTTDLLRDTLQTGRCDQWLRETYKTDLSYINKQISYALLEQSFLLDKFYSDPHPGNIKILPDNRFAFIDFGIMADSPQNRKHYHTILNILAYPLTDESTKRLSQSVFEFTASTLLQALQTCDEYELTESPMTPRVIQKYENMIASNQEIHDRILHTKREDYSFIWQELLRLGEQFRMQLPPGAFAGLRSAFLIKSFTSLLQPDVFVMRDVYREVTANIDPTRLTQDNTYGNDRDPESALEEISDWLTNLIEYDPLLYQRLAEI